MNRQQRRIEERRRKRIAKKLDFENPRMDFEFPPKQLQTDGAIISTYITIASAHRKYLENNNRAIPEPVYCRFLIDPGAYGTIVKQSIAEKARLKLLSEDNSLYGIGVIQQENHI